MSGLSKGKEEGEEGAMLDGDVDRGPSSCGRKSLER
jgi:hypothetical protein